MNLSWPNPGDLFHRRYRVRRLLKAGAMGAVFEVCDEATNSPRALKVMLPSLLEDPKLRERFTLEAKVTGGIMSDYIVHVLDAGVDDASGMPFLVMDLLRGEELGSMVRRRGALPAAEALTYGAQISLALDRSHAANIVHRDLKPQNIFVTTRDDRTPCIKILDFGIAKVLSESEQAQTGATIIGTPIYMAPEQINGNGAIGPATDIYALGHVMYALLTGEPYWSQEQKSAETIVALLWSIMAGPPEPPSVRAAQRNVQLPSSFDAWFARVTAERPKDRFQSAAAAIKGLAKALDLEVPVVSVALSTDPELVSPAAGARPSETLIAAQLARSIGTGPGLHPGLQGTGDASCLSSSTSRWPQKRSMPAALGAFGVAALLVAIMLVRRLGSPAGSPTDSGTSESGSASSAPLEVSAIPSTASPVKLPVPATPSMPDAGPGASSSAPPLKALRRRPDPATSTPSPKPTTSSPSPEPTTEPSPTIF